MPGETVSLAAALRGYTLGSAYANFLDDRLGSITPGKPGDLVLLSEDLFALDPKTCLGARVDLTVVGGEAVHRAG